MHFELSKAPHVGNDDAPVNLVELYHYACPHCYELCPVMEKVAADHPGKVVEYFMQFPLSTSFKPRTLASSSPRQSSNRPMHSPLSRLRSKCCAK